MNESHSVIPVEIAPEPDSPVPILCDRVPSGKRKRITVNNKGSNCCPQYTRNRDVNEPSKRLDSLEAGSSEGVQLERDLAQTTS